MTPTQLKVYEARLMELQNRTKGREPTDPAARARFDLEQERCARLYAIKYSGFPEPSNDEEEETDEK